MKLDEEGQKHPSFGQAVFNRMGGKTGRLYGSPLVDHQCLIRFKISRSELKHDLGSDRHYAYEQLIEVEFSPAQFADLLTSMNRGDGVPCTIVHVQGVGSIEPPPADDPVEHERVSASFKENTAETSRRLRDGLEKVRELLAKKSLSKQDKEDIEWVVGKALQDVECNAPFMIEQFGEAAERVVTAAKAEMAASVQTTLQQLGIERLDQLHRAASRERIEGHEEVGGERRAIEAEVVG